MTVVGKKSNNEMNERRLVGHLASSLDASGPFWDLLTKLQIGRYVLRFLHGGRELIFFIHETLELVNISC